MDERFKVNEDVQMPRLCSDALIRGQFGLLWKSRELLINDCKFFGSVSISCSYLPPPLRPPHSHLSLSRPGPAKVNNGGKSSCGGLSEPTPLSLCSYTVLSRRITVCLVRHTELTEVN